MLVLLMMRRRPRSAIFSSATLFRLVLNVAVLLAALLSVVVLLTMAVSVSTVPLGTAGLITATREIDRAAPAAQGPTGSTQELPAPLPPLAGTKVSPPGTRSVTHTFW